MIIAGLRETSLIDYPGMLSCVVFLTGCNFTCPFCHNPQLARGEYPQHIPLNELSVFLFERREWLDGLVISGGEPTLHPDLAELCRIARDFNLSVKLDTNGSRPEVLTRLFEQKLVDYIAMDIKTDPAAYGPPLCAQTYAPAVLASIKILMNHAPDYEFRTTCVAPFIDTDTVTAIARAIGGARRYILQPYRPAELLDPEFTRSAHPYSSDEMTHLQTLAAPWVGSCTIR
jgi:pyruvate formate lyase activating enzyme